MKKPRYKWEPLRQGYAKPISEQLIEDHFKLSPGMTREQVIADLTREEKATTVWINHLYQVVRRELKSNLGTVIHLNIRRRDGGPILRDWRHFQQIKNELIGEECEAIELYPAESRLVDTSNKYHLFGMLDPTFRFPFGDFWGDKRDVQYESGKSPGTRQRPL